MSEDTKTTVSCLTSTRDRLKTFGKKGETYDIVLNRLMDRASSPIEPATATAAATVG